MRRGMEMKKVVCWFVSILDEKISLERGARWDVRCSAISANCGVRGVFFLVRGKGCKKIRWLFPLYIAIRATQIDITSLSKFLSVIPLRDLAYCEACNCDRKAPKCKCPHQLRPLSLKRQKLFLTTKMSSFPN